MLNSEVFSHGERQSRFLRYIVEQTLDGQAERLNQFAVGIDVFDRDSSFDPTIDSIVRVEAGRLRAKLTEYYADIGATDAVKIELPKGGYVVSIEFDSLPSDPKTGVRSLISRLPITAILASLVAAVIGILVLAPQIRTSMSIGDAEKSSLSSNTDRPDNPAIAVLPFDNMSADSSQNYFSDGITEDVITDLSIVSGLRVIARNSTFVYKGKATAISDIARDLNVSHVLEGSVRKAGDRLRITAQLIDVSTQSHVWAERFDRPIGDVFAVQDEVAQKIVRALEIALTETEERRLSRNRTASVDAHDALLRGKEQFYLFKPDNIARSVELFSTAIERDPGYAEAYAWKARALVFQFIAGFVAIKQETVGQALVLANHAVELDKFLPMAHANLAWAMRWNSQLDEAASAVARAVELDPNFAEAYLWQSLILSSAGEGKSALRAIDHSTQLNPNYGVTSIFAVGRAKFELGDLDGAIEQFDRGIDRNPNFLPNHVYKVFAHESKKELNAADRARKIMAEVNPHYQKSASYRYYFSERR